MFDGMLARAHSFCLLALSRFDRRVLALLLVRVDCAVLCCACLRSKVESKYIQEGCAINTNLVGN